jgi:orotidine-5'-phosphate decarboxylase
MNYSDKLLRRIATTGTGLCVGLDPRPETGGASEIRSFLRQVITETLPYAAAFKPNSAYFECLGPDGFRLLQELRSWIPSDVPIVYDAKRSDIGETQKYYAKAAFDVLGADAITLNPFLGFDSIEPFLSFNGKGLYLLALTSNPGAADLEMQQLADGRQNFEIVAEMAHRAAGSPAEVGFVVGLTNAASAVLSKIPDVPLLVPGLGAQGGEISALRNANRQAPILVNVSRGILYAEPTKSFAEKAAHWADVLRKSTISP